MSTIKRIAKNTGLMFISQILTYGLAFIYLIYSARYLGVENFGILSFATAFAGIIVIFTDLGLSTLMTREVARDKSLANKYLKNIGAIKIVLAFITFISAILFIFILGYTEKIIIIVALVTLYTILNSFAAMFYSFFQAHERMKHQAFGHILHSSLLLFGTLILIHYNFDLLAFAVVYLIVGITVSAYGFLICGWKYILPKVEVDTTFWKKLIKKALPLSLIVIFSTIAFRIDTVLLSILDGNTAVGIYSAAYRLMEVLIFIPTVFTASVYPVFSKFHISSKDSLKIAYKRSFKYLIIIGLPIAFGITLLADKIILIIYGAEFTGSTLALKILIWAIPVIFLSYLTGTMVISINRQNLALKVMIVAMTLNIILNIMFIPIYSFVAASIITVITESVDFLIIFFFLSKILCKIRIKSIVIKPLIASIIMSLFIVNVNLNIILLIITSILIYFISLVLLRTFSQEDLAMFKHIIKIR